MLKGWIFLTLSVLMLPLICGLAAIGRDQAGATLTTVVWLTGICLLLLMGRAIYIYIEWLWRTRQIRENDLWLARLELERKAGETDSNRAA